VAKTKTFALALPTVQEVTIKLHFQGTQLHHKKSVQNVLQPNK
jgi:hypothetical protein